LTPVITNSSASTAMTVMRVVSMNFLVERAAHDATAGTWVKAKSA
jgi:hypothetical protein